jgi:iron-sulfur cluster assembly accessory protein
MNMTEAAAKQIQTFITPEEGVRLAIEGGGCAGFQYRFGMVPIKDITEEDLIIEKLNTKIYVDIISAQYLQGVVIDWIDDTFGSHFKLNNPNAKTHCGCGSSFS